MTNDYFICSLFFFYYLLLYYFIIHNYIIILFYLFVIIYRFTFVDIGAQGRASDGGVYARCALEKAIQDRVINLPQDRRPVGFETALPYCMVGDEAFPLKTYLMRPYPQRVLNDRKRVSYKLF